MVTSVQAYLALLVLIALERGVELVLSARTPALPAPAEGWRAAGATTR